MGVARKRHFVEPADIRHHVVAAAPGGEAEEEGRVADWRVVGCVDRAVRMRVRNRRRPFAAGTSLRIQSDDRQPVAAGPDHHGAFAGPRRQIKQGFLYLSKLTK